MNLDATRLGGWGPIASIRTTQLEHRIRPALQVPGHWDWPELLIGGGSAVRVIRGVKVRGIVIQPEVITT